MSFTLISLIIHEINRATFYLMHPVRNTMVDSVILKVNSLDIFPQPTTKKFLTIPQKLLFFNMTFMQADVPDNSLCSELHFKKWMELFPTAK